jgi:SAM-dependent methyltransferase
VAACPVCESTATDDGWRDLPDRLFGAAGEERFALRRCRSCRTRFLWPVPPASRLASYYPDDYWVGEKDEAEARPRGGLLEIYRRLVLGDHVRFVRRIARAQRRRGTAVRVLDVGCGDGSFLAALGEPDCLGLDLSFSALRAVRRRGIAAVRGVLTDPPFAEAAFSLITSFHYLEHVPAPYPSLAAMRRLLGDSGDLVLEVPNAASWQARLFGRRWAGFDVPRHLVNFTADTLRQALERAGFEVVTESHACLRDNPTTIANSLAPRWFPPARVARGGRPDGAGAALANLGYLALTMASTPFCLLESLLHRGASVRVHARPR